MKTLCAFLLLSGAVLAGDVSLFTPQADVSLFGASVPRRCPVCKCAPCACAANGEECDCEGDCGYVPQVIGMTPIGEADGHVTAAVANYSEAKRMAEATGKPLVVLVGQPEETIAVRAASATKEDAIVCVPSGAEEKLWAKPGVYEYVVKGKKLFTKTPTKAITKATISLPGSGECANGRCYR